MRHGDRAYTDTAVQNATLRIGAEVYLSAAQSLGTGAWTAINFDASRADTHGFHSASTNPSRLTIPAGEAGTYLVVAHLSLAASTTGLRSARIALNGSISNNMADQRIPAHPSEHHLVASATGSVNAGDYIELYGYQNSGGPLDASGAVSGWLTKMSITKLGD